MSKNVSETDYRIQLESSIPHVQKAISCGAEMIGHLRIADKTWGELEDYINALERLMDGSIPEGESPYEYERIEFGLKRMPRNLEKSIEIQMEDFPDVAQ